MGDLSLFLKKNKKVKENLKIAATQSLCDERGKPLLWEVKPLTTREDAAVRDECTIEVQVTGKPGLYRQKLNVNRYLARMAAACVVYPNLNDKELQDSYGVMGAEQLLPELIDNPGEYDMFLQKIQAYQGFDQSFQEKIDEAKN